MKSTALEEGPNKEHFQSVTRCEDAEAAGNMLMAVGDSGDRIATGKFMSKDLVYYCDSIFFVLIKGTVDLQYCINFCCMAK